MIGVIRDNQHIYLGQMTQGVEEILVKYFSAQDPKSFYIQAMRDGWDGVCRKYNTRKQRLALPFLNELKKCCMENRIPLEIVDQRGAPEFPAPQIDQITKDLLPGMTLEDYQVRGLKAACTEDHGIFWFTTGGGKTEVACGLVKMFRCPTVIITEQIVVLEQIVKRLEARNVVHNNDIGLFCHGNMPDGNIVIVGSIQSLSTPVKPDKKDIIITDEFVYKSLTKMATSCNEDIYTILPKPLAEALIENPEGVRNLKGKYLQIAIQHFFDKEFDRMTRAYKTRLENATRIQDMVNKCDLLLIDEADLAVTNQYGNLCKRFFKGRRRYGFSGTPFEKSKPVQALVLKEHLGSIISQASRSEIQDRGRIIPIKFYMISVGDPSRRHEKAAYDIAMKEEIVENVNFHQQVANIVNAFPNDGTLILIDTSPIGPIGESLEKLIPNSKFLYGETPQAERRKYIELFESRELKCLIGSKIFKRGLDLKGGVENLIIIGGGKSWSDFDQKIGRAVRVNKRGWSRVFSFLFLNNEYLYKHSRENLKTIVSMGYPTKVIVNGAEIDGERFIKSGLRIKTG